MTAALDQRVRIEAVRPVAERIRELTLSPADGSPLPAWEPGAHVDLVLDDDRVRQYSLCGDVDDRYAYRLAVLREPAGRGGSRYVHEVLRPGDDLVLRGPRNHFALQNATNYVFIAGGIGICPLLPMLRQVARTGSAWRFLYIGRNRSTMAYVNEVESFGDRASVIATEDTGRPDLAAVLSGQPPGTLVYCCGPEHLLAAVQDLCVLRASCDLRVERFAAKTVPAEPNQPFVVELASSGISLAVPAERSLVDVLCDAGINVVTSCEEGICGTCETKVLAGVPDHRDCVLSDEERKRGDCMMVCVSRSRTSHITLQL